MEIQNLSTLIAVITIVFMIMPVFMLIYFWTYTKKKKYHHQEKMQMQHQFDQELLTTEQEAREQAMQTIGADLHDNIGQLLSLTALTLKSIPLESQSKNNDKISTSIELLTKANAEMRQLGKLLQGDQLIAQGLPSAIEQEINWLSRSGLYQMAFHTESLPKIANVDKDLFYFRILQEILNNIIKHAQASSIDIRLSHSGTHLELTVQDNGIGIGPEQHTNHGNGLGNMKKRATLMGGTLTIESSPETGTRITLQAPYP